MHILYLETCSNSCDDSAGETKVAVTTTTMMLIMMMVMVMMTIFANYVTRQIATLVYKLRNTRLEIHGRPAP